MITIRNLYLKYIREYYALYDVNLEIEDGETVVLFGEEHSGKTSLLRVLAKLEKFNKGEIYIKNIPIKKLNLKNDIAIGYLPETPVFLNNKTVYENLKYALKVRKVQEKEQEQLINSALINFNVEKFKEVKTADLSLFESYYISLVRMALKPVELVLIDNIFERLSEDELKVIISMIKELFISKKINTIIATTNEKIAKEFGAKVINFKNGSII